MDIFLKQLLFSLLEQTILFLLIYISRPIIRKKLGSEWVEICWAALSIRMIFPFIKKNPYSLFSLLASIRLKPDSTVENYVQVQTGSLSDSSNILTEQVDKLSSHSFGTETIYILYSIIFILLILVHLFSFRQIYCRYIKNCIQIDDQRILNIFKTAASTYKVSKKIQFYTSQFKSPILIGCIRPKILIPIYLMDKSNESLLKAAAAHEIAHIRRIDNYKLIIINIVRCVFWYSPVIHLLCHEFRKDIEQGCDEFVLSLKSENYIVSYANSVVKLSANEWNIFAKHLFPRFSQVNNLKKRIIDLYQWKMEFKNPGKPVKIIMIVLLLFLFTGSINSYGSNNYEYIANLNNNFLDDNYRTAIWFEGNEKIYTNYKESLKSAVPAASIIKIPMSLALLEYSIVDKNNSVITWDGTPQPYQIWEQNHTLESALRYSVSWYYEKSLTNNAHILGNFLRSINYPSYEGFHVSLKDFLEKVFISPLKQTTFMKNLYLNNINCSVENQMTVKKMLFRKKIEDIAIYGKTGTTLNNKAIKSGWFTGYAVRGDWTIAFSFYHPKKGGSEIEKDVTLYLKMLLNFYSTSPI